MNRIAHRRTANFFTQLHNNFFFSLFSKFSCVTLSDQIFFFFSFLKCSRAWCTRSRFDKSFYSTKDDNFFLLVCFDISNNSATRTLLNRERRRSLLSKKWIKRRKKKTDNVNTHDENGFSVVCVEIEALTRYRRSPINTFFKVTIKIWKRCSTRTTVQHS